MEELQHAGYQNSSINLNLLDYSWTAAIKDNGGNTRIIWYTAWPMLKRFTAEVLWVASDYPGFRKNNDFIIKE